MNAIASATASLTYFAREAQAAAASASENLQWALEAEAAGDIVACEDYLSWACHFEAVARRYDGELDAMAAEGHVWF